MVSCSTHQGAGKGTKSELCALIEQILQTGVMSLEDQLRIHRICDLETAFSLEEYMALELLRKSLLGVLILLPLGSLHVVVRAFCL